MYICIYIPLYKFTRLYPPLIHSFNTDLLKASCNLISCFLLGTELTADKIPNLTSHISILKGSPD